MALSIGKVVALLELHDNISANIEKTAKTVERASASIGGDLASGGKTAADGLAATTSAADTADATLKKLGVTAKDAADMQTRAAALSTQATERIARGYTTLDQEHKRYLDNLERQASKTQDVTKQMGVMENAMVGLGKRLLAMFAVERVIAYGQAIVDRGSEIADMASKTGLGTTAVQTFGYAAEQTGATLDQVGTAVTAMSRNLVGGSDSTVEAFGRIGLSIEQVRAMAPDQAFLAIAEAIRRVPDPLVQADAAMRIFGRGGADLLPAIKAGFVEATDEASRMGVVMSTNAVSGLDALGDAWDRMKGRMSAATGETVGNLVTIITKLAELRGMLPGGGASDGTDGGVDQLVWDSPDRLRNRDQRGWAQRALSRVGGAIMDPTSLVRSGFDEAAKAANRLNWQKNIDADEKSHAFGRVGLPIDALQGPLTYDDTQTAAIERQATRQLAVLNKHNAEITRLADERQRRLDRLTGRDGLNAASQSTADIQRVGLGALDDTAVLRVFDQLADAREIARRIEPGAVAGLTAAMTTLADHPSVRAAAIASGRKVFQQVFDPSALRGVMPSGALTGSALAQAIDPLPRAIKAATVDTYALRKGLDDVSLPLDVITERFDHFIAQQSTLRREITDGVGGALAGLPGLMQQAFTGGGGVLGAAKALGVQLAEAIITPLTERLKSVGQKVSVAVGASGASALGGVTGGSAGAWIGGTTSAIAGAALATTAWGTAAAATVGGMVALSAATLGIGAAAVGVYLLAKHFMTVSKEVKQARVDVQSFQEELWKTMRPQQVAEAAGRGWAATLLTVSNAYVRMGRTSDEAERIVAQLLNTDKPEAARAAMAEINTVVGQFEARLKAANDRFTPLLSSSLELGQRLPESLLLSIQRLRDMGDLSEENIALFDRLAGGPEVDYKKFEEAAGRYGINPDALGIGYKQSKADTSAQQMVDDVELLSRGGASMGTILHGMREEISQLVADSLQFGTTLPANMQPWIAELERTGQLVDTNGKALGDLSRLHFSDSLETSFARITDALEELVRTLQGPLQSALNQIPKTVGINVEMTESWRERSGGYRPTDTLTELGAPESLVRPDGVPSVTSAFGGGRDDHVRNPIVQVRGNLVLPDGRVLAEVMLENAGDVLASRGVR